MAFDNCLPSNDLLVLLRVVYVIAWSLLTARLLERFWSDVVAAEEQFRTFSWQEVTCECCSMNHISEDGQPVACDREVLEKCVVQWFGSVGELESCVRTTVRDKFISQVTRGFPLGFWSLVGAYSFIVWGQVDSFAGRSHGGAYWYAASILIVTLAWWLWTAPVQYLTFGRIARWMQRKRREKWPAPRRYAALGMGYLAAVANAGGPGLLQWSCYIFLIDPVLAASTFAGATLLLAAVAYHALAQPAQPQLPGSRTAQS